MNNAVYDALPQAFTVFVGGNLLSTVINVIQASGMMYMNFKKYKNQLSEEYDEKM